MHVHLESLAPKVSGERPEKLQLQDRAATATATGSAAAGIAAGGEALLFPLHHHPQATGTSTTGTHVHVPPPSSCSISTSTLHPHPKSSSPTGLSDRRRKTKLHNKRDSSGGGREPLGRGGLGPEGSGSFEKMMLFSDEFRERVWHLAHPHEFPTTTASTSTFTGGSSSISWMSPTRDKNNKGGAHPQDVPVVDESSPLPSRERSLWARLQRNRIRGLSSAAREKRRQQQRALRGWRDRLLALLLAVALIALCEWSHLLHQLGLLRNQCRWPHAGGARGESAGGPGEHHAGPEEVRAHPPVRALLLGDVHLSGSRNGRRLYDRLRQERQARGTLRAAAALLKPEIVFILGDLFDEGKMATDAQWGEYLVRYHQVIWDAFPSTPVHVVAGSSDVGPFVAHPIWERLAHRFEASFGAASRVVERRGVRFVMLNSLALSGDPRMPSHQRTLANMVLERAHVTPLPTIALLHLPLHRANDTVCAAVDAPRCAPWHDRRVCKATSSYVDGRDVLPKAESANILRQLNPRAVFSAHTHQCCERTHSDATVEVTLPAFSWRYRDDPGFLLLSVARKADGAASEVDIQYTNCKSVRESTVIWFYSLVLGLLLVFWINPGGFFCYRVWRAIRTALGRCLHDSPRSYA